MCYNLVYMTKKKLDYARRLGATEEELSNLEEELRKYEELDGKPPMFHANAFTHPEVPVVTNEDPERIQFYEWGLVPGWVKNLQQAGQMQNKTANARGETIFEKPSFRSSAKNKRCLVLVDGFFEYHTYKGKKYPFYIRMKSGEPFTMAGLWESKEVEGIQKNTFSIVTTDANELMAKIHNNPAASNTHRMPVILPKELQYEWLKPIVDNVDKESIQELISPHEDGELEAHTVGKLAGKAAIGNEPKALEEYFYSDLHNPL